MLYVLIALGLLALLLFARRPRATPTHCRCGRRADVFDHERPWKVWCGRCYLKQRGGDRTWTRTMSTGTDEIEPVKAEREW